MWLHLWEKRENESTEAVRIKWAGKTQWLDVKVN